MGRIHSSRPHRLPPSKVYCCDLIRKTHVFLRFLFGIFMLKTCTAVRRVTADTQPDFNLELVIVSFNTHQEVVPSRKFPLGTQRVLLSPHVVL